VLLALVTRTVPFLQQNMFDARPHIILIADGHADGNGVLSFPLKNEMLQSHRALRQRPPGNLHRDPAPSSAQGMALGRADRSPFAICIPVAAASPDDKAFKVKSYALILNKL
jgi:hypothetical protein